MGAKAGCEGLRAPDGAPAAALKRAISRLTSTVMEIITACGCSVTVGVKPLSWLERPLCCH